MKIRLDEEISLAEFMTCEQAFHSGVELVFTFVNWIKLPFFCVDRAMLDLPIFAAQALITPATLLTSAKFFPLVPLGVWLGVWLNRRFSEQAFVRVIYAILLVTGLQLIGNYFAEARLLNAAHQFQQATDWHTRAPVL